MLEKPYYRIFRPGIDEIVLNKCYANDRISLCRALKLIVNDLGNIFEYIEPCNDNLNTYSHRTYELFLRTCTEFEANCKSILKANGYSKTGTLNIQDYYKIDKSSKLSDYKVKLNIWKPNSKIYMPFSDWKDGYSLKWYQDYNKVKHDREENFKYASLENLVQAVTGLICILFSQFGIETLYAYNACAISTKDEDGYKFRDDFMFSIKEPDNWIESEKYNISNKNIVSFEKFDFNSI